jgi:hypothetical protein
MELAIFMTSVREWLRIKESYRAEAVIAGWRKQAITTMISVRECWEKEDQELVVAMAR